MKEYPNVYIVTKAYNPIAVFYEKGSAVDYIQRHDQRHDMRVIGPFKCN